MSGEDSRSAEDGRRDLARALVALGVAAIALVICAVRARYPLSNDDSTHYLIAKSVAVWPWKVIDFWGRPAFTALHALPAQHSFFACRLTSVLLTLVAAGLTYGAARALRLPRAWLAVPLLLTQPEVVTLGFAALTETPGAMLLAGALWAFVAGRTALAALLFGTVPLARAEGFFIGVFVGAWFVGLALRDRFGGERTVRVARRWLPRIALLAVCALLWNALGWWSTGGFSGGDPVWLWTANVYAKGPPGQYGFGPWWWYLVSQPHIVGPVGAPLLLVGLVRGLGGWGPAETAGQRRFVAALWLYFFLLQQILWTFGLFRTAGYMRFFVTIGPAVALIALDGLGALLAELARRHARAAQVAVAVCLIGAVAALPARVNFQRYSPDYETFGEMVAFYEAYVREHGKPPQLLCNYHHLDFRLGLIAKNDWYPGLDRETLAAAPPGTIVLWVYPYMRNFTHVEPEDFYAPEELARFAEARARGENVLHQLSRTKPGWKQLADFSRLRGPHDEWPFFQKVLLKTK